MPETKKKFWGGFVTSLKAVGAAVVAGGGGAAIDAAISSIQGGQTDPKQIRTVVVAAAVTGMLGYLTRSPLQKSKFAPVATDNAPVEFPVVPAPAVRQKSIFAHDYGVGDVRWSDTVLRFKSEFTPYSRKK